MPYINIRIASDLLTSEQIRQLVAEITGCMTNILGKKGELTSVHIEQADSRLWGIGGVLVTEGGTRAAHMDINITAGTNSGAEKAAMVEAGYGLLVDVLGTLPEATYVVIHDLPAGNWGYAGKTQAARTQQGLTSIFPPDRKSQQI